MLQAITSKKDMMMFGKYAGKTVGDVMQYNAQYFLWLADEKIIRLDTDLQKELIKVASDQHIECLRGLDIYPMDDPSDDIDGGGCDPNMWGDLGF